MLLFYGVTLGDLIVHENKIHELMVAETRVSSEERALDIRVAEEIFGLNVFKVKMKGEVFYYTSHKQFKDEDGEIGMLKVFNPTEEKSYLKFYSSDLTEAVLVAQKVLSQVDKRQSLEKNEKTQETVCGYGAIFNLQLVSLPYGGVQNWQADFCEISKKGPMETTKTFGVGKSPAMAICLSALASWRKEKNYKAPDKEIKDVTGYVKNLMSSGQLLLGRSQEE